MRADRLLSLLLLLQARGRMTAQELAEHLEVSERTIYRDIDALSSAGIPIYTERGPGGGCELIDGYQTKLTGLTEAEVRALFLLGISGPLVDLGLGQALESALLKLSAALPATSRSDAVQARQRIYMDTTLLHRAHQALPHLELIQEAVWQNYTLRLTYGGYTRRYIDPYGLVSKAGVWYLIGAVAGAIEVLRVSRIRAAETTIQHFIRPPEFDLAAYWTEHHVQFLARRNAHIQRKKKKLPRTAHSIAATNSQRKKIKMKTKLHYAKAFFPSWIVLSKERGKAKLAFPLSFEQSGLSVICTTILG